MPYIGKSMSANAKRAHDQGLMPISSFGRKQLDQCGFKYSVAFFRWLCKKKYIKSNGLHHTGAAPRMTKFYSPGTIGSFARQANLPALYAMYRGKMSADEVLESLGVRYYSVECAAGILGMKQVGTVVCDVVYYDGFFISQ